MKTLRPDAARLHLPLVILAASVLSACQSPASHRRSADEAASGIITEKQQEALGRTEPFTVETPADTLRRRLLVDQDLPRIEDLSLGGDPLGSVKDPLPLTLMEALQVGARNSREYQSGKEDIFRAALDLDLERDEFRNTFAGLVEGLIETDGGGEEGVSGAAGSAEGSIARRLHSGAELTARIALDLVKLLTGERSSSLGLLADATVSIPLLRGAGRHVVTEPLTQAEREVVYAIWEFERFKRRFAVDVADEYLGVLQAEQELENAEENYRGLIVSTRRARRMAEAGRMPWFEFDQTLQNELRARNRWILAGESLDRRSDGFKTLLGLPTDARVVLDRGELKRLGESARRNLGTMERETEEAEVPAADEPVVLDDPGEGTSGPLELDERVALHLALENRLDLKVAVGRVDDARRRVAVAADALRAELTLFGSAAAGESRSIASADLPDASLDFSEGSYSALLVFDPPLERTAERNAYRQSFIDLDRAMRRVQELEDRVKLEVRDRLRNLLESREGIRIQAMAVEIAERRVKSTDLFLQAGRAQARDLLESREALLQTQNALLSALVGYRIAELQLQRDLGVLAVDEQGLWTEYTPPGEDG